MTDSLVRTLERSLRRCLRERDKAQADLLLTQLQEHAPLSVATRGFELEYLTLCERFTEAEPLAEQLLRLHPGSPRIQYLVGKLAYRQRRYAQAEACFRESHRLHPNWWTRLFLGKSLTQRGEFSEAEAILTSMVSEYPFARTALSWLYERQGQHEQALLEIQAYLRDHPADEFALKQQQRLLSQSLEPQQVVSEVQFLQEMGEQVDENLIPEYIESLLKTGEAEKARLAFAEILHGVSTPIAVRTAWKCYRLQAYDVAFQLFHRTLAENLDNIKFLSAYETAAKRTGQVNLALEAYQRLCDKEPRMYGRIRRLGRG